MYLDAALCNIVKNECAKANLQATAKARLLRNMLLDRSVTYLLRQMISADVEGCGAFKAFGFGVDVDEEEDAAGVGGIEASADSSPFAVLFFFLAMMRKPSCLQID